MLKPALDREMRSITQAAVPSQQATPLSNGHSEQTKPRAGVRNITSLTELENALSSAAKSCAVVFFTSSTCAPCKVLYPTYDALAEEAGGKAVLIKVDINFAREIAAKYKVQATPTIMTFLKGKKDEEWAGADVVRLRTTVQLLIQSAHPRHPHSDLEVSRLLSAAEKPIKYTKIPPLDKLKVKLGQFATHPVVTRMHNFITTSTADDTIKQGNRPTLPSPIAQT
jgi:thioredoxin-like negative regulator of GroEL